MDPKAYNPDGTVQERVRTWYELYPELKDGARVAVASVAKMETKREFARRTFETNPVTGKWPCLVLPVAYDQLKQREDGTWHGFIRTRQLLQPVIKDYLTGKTSLDGVNWLTIPLPNNEGMWLNNKYVTDKRHQHHFWEVILKYKEPRGLALFALGATMMHGAQSSLYLREVEGRTGGRPEWPNTWEEYRALYLNEGKGLDWATRATTYLGQRNFPGKDGTTDESQERLTCGDQTGSMKEADDYYRGTGRFHKTPGGVQASAIEVRGWLK